MKDTVGSMKAEKELDSAMAYVSRVLTDRLRPGLPTGMKLTRVQEILEDSLLEQLTVHQVRVFLDYELRGRG